MRVDPAVTQRKYQRECRRLKDQYPTLQANGCEVVRTEFPFVDAIVVCRGPVVHRVPVPGHDPICRPYRDIPIASSTRRVGLRITLDDYDIRAPGVELHDPVSWKLLPFAAIPPACEIVERRSNRVVIEEHHAFKRPFLCIPGTREFHEHKQHANVDWLSQRRSSSTFDLLMRAARAFAARGVLKNGPGGPVLEWEAV